MRTFSNSAFSIQYPDIVSFAFDTVGINVERVSAPIPDSYKMTLEIVDGVTGDTITDIRAAMDGKVSFDMAAYMRALMAERMTAPFDGFQLPMCSLFNATLYFNDVAQLSFSTFAMWGSLGMGEVFNGDRTVKLWHGYPNITAFFCFNTSTINGVSLGVDGLSRLPQAGSYTEYVADGTHSPSTYWNFSQDGHTVASSIIDGLTIKGDDNITFGEDGNVFTLLHTDGKACEVKITAPTYNDENACIIKKWTLRGSAGAPYHITTSDGQVYHIANNEVTIERAGLNALSDTLIISDDQEGNALYISAMSIELDIVGVMNESGNLVGMDDTYFLSYRRTGQMSVVGESREATITVEWEDACGKGIFLRWIDGMGLPVSWFFRKGHDARSITTSSSLRSTMSGAHIANGTDMGMIQVDDKDDKVTMEVFYPHASREGLRTLLSVLTSPVVEAWNEDGRYWYRVNIATKSWKDSGAEHQDYIIELIMPAKEAQRL